MNYTTIPEVAKNMNVPISSIRWQLEKNKINPVVKERWTINGYNARPYDINEMNKALKTFKPDKLVSLCVAREPIKNHYSQKEICHVLRSHIKNPLNNKIVKDWNFHDWQEFENLKINLNK